VLATAANKPFDHRLIEHGVMEPARAYEPPFDDVTRRGPDNVLPAEEVDDLLRALAAVRQTAMPLRRDNSRTAFQ